MDKNSPDKSFSIGWKDKGKGKGTEKGNEKKKEKRSQMLEDDDDDNDDNDNSNNGDVMGRHDNEAVEVFLERLQSRLRALEALLCDAMMESESAKTICAGESVNL